MKYIVDTNVSVVANGRNTHASEDCQLACICKLLEIKERGIVFLDDLGLVLEEYKRHLNHSGEPGTGDAFYRYLFENQYRDQKCKLVSITPKEDSFEEFPDDPNLADFDTDDHKFVAIAVVANKSPAILNAVDSDWYDYEQPLKNNGLKIKQLCPNNLNRHCS